jgi:hypothetical protein
MITMERLITIPGMRTVARQHAAVADEHHALEPEALLEVVEHFGNRLGL